MTIQVPPAYEPMLLNFVCTQDCRSTEHYVRALAQFGVEYNHRYDPGQPSPGMTYCNIFLWDATSALQCEIPHWIDQTGNKVPPFTTGAKELSALGVIGWLRAYGLDHGWMELTRTEASLRAAKGFPVCVTWQNQAVYPDGLPKPSHVAMVLPPLTKDEIRIAQSGAQNLWDVPVTAGFGNLHPLQFWSHA
jgi:hypothetical protein